MDIEEINKLVVNRVYELTTKMHKLEENNLIYQLEWNDADSRLKEVKLFWDTLIMKKNENN